MISQNGSARFEKQGISVTLSADTVNGWQISEDDEIQIRIEKIAETAFSLRIFVRGEEVTEIPGTVVEFQTSVFDGIQSPETVTAEDIQGNQYTVSCQEKQNILHMEISQTGDYFLTDSGSDEKSTGFISGDEDSGSAEEESRFEDDAAENADDSGIQILAKYSGRDVIVPVLLVVCVLVSGMIFAYRKKHR